MRIRWFFAAVLSIFLLSACHTVTEDDTYIPETSYSGTVTESDTYTKTETAPVITETAEETDVSDETTFSDIETPAYTEISSETGSRPPETEEQTSSSAETSSAPQTAAPLTETQETTAHTLQYESPFGPEMIGSEPDMYSGSYKAVNFSEQKGFWITYLEYMSILKGRSENSFRQSVETYFGNIADLGFNTVYVQVRAFGDAYYDSSLFPSGEQYNGTIGSGSDYDALDIMVKAAHKNGLSIHAWVNPMRLMTSSQMQGISSSFPIKKWYDSDSLCGKYIVKYGDRWYLDPAYDEVTDLIADGISEIISGYDVDGIQIDDYFYPTTSAEFDSEAYAGSGTSLSLTDWRISNVNKMVRKLYNTVHSANSSVIFGISPQGSVENDYNEAYADVRTWCSSGGYCDYILPQVYFGFNNASLPYADVISQWDGMVGNSGVKLVIGLAAYKIGAEDNYAGPAGRSEWTDNSDIISRQMKLAETLGNYGGTALYRYGSVFEPDAEVAAQVSKEIENIKK